MAALQPGPVFFVDGGELFLEGLAVRDGNATNSVDVVGDDPSTSVVNGGGVHAFDATITVTRCEFEDNFAQRMGGGIFANRSTLVVEASVFRRCSAGFMPSFVDEEDVLGAGGGIGVQQTNVFINGTLFDSCYASKKGGGFHQDDGGTSVAYSRFLNNNAGGNNTDDGEDPVGEGGAASFSGCRGSFDGLGACGANDTTFSENRVAQKGGAIVLASPNSPSRIEFHRCTVENSTAGKYFEDDPQGEGGAIVVGGGTTVVLEDCLCSNNICGKKGGVISMSSYKDPWDDGSLVEPLTEGYGFAILRGSTFRNNSAIADNGGVANLAENASLLVQGDGNVFEGNMAAQQDGAVFAATTSTVIDVEGGEFVENYSDAGGVLWTKGEVIIRGGTFANNSVGDEGGVMFLSADSKVILANGRFEGNEAAWGGGVANVEPGATLVVTGGEYTANKANTNGGVFAVGDDATIEITGGRFLSNEADYGGFLYTEQNGSTSCEGATVEDNNAVDGGGVYAVDGAVVEWKCDLLRNSALSGQGIYAREKATMTVSRVTLSGNVATTGSVVFVVSGSAVRTSEVEFNDTSGSGDLLAVQVDATSRYMGEDTSFVGFAGEAVVNNEGALYLDQCDFRGSNAAVLVQSGGEDAVVVIRNTILWNDNYFDDENQPKGESLINVNVTCEGAPTPPCSNGSPCIEGDIGVYCLCYARASDESQEICLHGDVESLALEAQPGQTDDDGVTAFTLPDTPEKDLVLSLGDDGARSSTSSDVSGEGAAAGGVMWEASVFSVPSSGEMNWTVFPSSGMLLPGQSVNLRVAATSIGDFNGEATAKVVVDGTAEGAAIAVQETVRVAFYHCNAGQVWSEEDCELCTDLVENMEGIDCSASGSTTSSLPIEPGFWRASLSSFDVRECLNEEACRGGSNVADETQYCNEGYEGPLCAVCSAGYGSGVANSCHRCSSGFKAGMYFVVATVSLLALALAAPLAVYLIGGTSAVSTTIRKSKQSVSSGLVRSVHQRSERVRVGFRSVSESTVGSSALPAFSPAIASTNGGMAAAGAGVLAEAPGSQRAGKTKTEKKTITARVLTVLARLPLSKLKIVIVVWQISGAFAGITQVPFPSAYEKFLEFIGVFSLDLGWIVSAACLATGIGFFDKLLMVTIGPVILLSLLGVTFWLGLKDVKRVDYKRAADGFSSNLQGGRSNPGSTVGGGSSRSSTNPETDPELETTSAAAIASETMGPSCRTDSVPRPPSRRQRAPVVPKGLFASTGGDETEDAEQDRLWSLISRHTTLALVILYLGYSQVSTVVFQAFSCDEFPDIEKSYLRADFSEECYTAKHEAWKIYAGIMICVYPVGIPAAFCYLLVRQHVRINPPVGPEDDQQTIMEKRAADRSIAPTYFLWNAFVPNRYYYEVLECVRRLLLTGLLVFLQPDTPGQVAFGCMFAFISLMVFELLRPHSDGVERQLYRTVRRRPALAFSRRGLGRFFGPS